MCVVGFLCACLLSMMPLQLYDLPFDMLEMIGEFYDDLEQREAASTLQERVYINWATAEVTDVVPPSRKGGQ